MSKLSVAVQVQVSGSLANIGLLFALKLQDVVAIIVQLLLSLKLTKSIV
ncbi:MAG: hypothetical protein LBU14_00065 [Candidatus Peribacteria bacterium]|jgi:hypothetical protein|nr:hypothetical protein [Candidatus Peribacteria bacterium]